MATTRRKPAVRDACGAFGCACVVTPPSLPQPLHADGVFVGSFRGRLGPKQVGSAAAPAGVRRSAKEAVVEEEDEQQPVGRDGGAHHGQGASDMECDPKPENNAAQANEASMEVQGGEEAAPVAEAAVIAAAHVAPAAEAEAAPVQHGVSEAPAAAAAAAVDADPWSDANAFEDPAAVKAKKAAPGGKKKAAAVAAGEEGAAPPAKKPRSGGAKAAAAAAAGGDVAPAVTTPDASAPAAQPLCGDAMHPDTAAGAPVAAEPDAAAPAGVEPSAVAAVATDAAPVQTKTVREVDIDALPEAPACLTRDHLEALVNDWCGRNVSKSKLHRKRLAALLPDGVLAAAVAAQEAAQPLPVRPEGTAPSSKTLPMRTRTVVVHAKTATHAPDGTASDGPVADGEQAADAPPAAATKPQSPWQAKPRKRAAPVAPTPVHAAAMAAPAMETAPPVGAQEPMDASAQAATAEEVPAGAPAPEAQQEAAAPAAAARPTGRQPKKSGCGGAVTRKPTRGRVKRGSVKSGELVAVGSLVVADGWHNAGYIFPDGFTSRMVFRSSVELDQLCIHECLITSTGSCAPKPTFRITAADRPEEPVEGKSATMCWNLVLARINGEIARRREEGEDLPPPPKTAIAGPEYFGLNAPDVVAAIEALDPEHKCTDYWAGKEAREEMANDPEAACARATAAGAAAPKPRAPRAVGGAGGGKGKGKRRRKGAGSDDEDVPTEEVDEEAVFASRKWSAIGRGERARARAGGEGGDAAAPVDESNPCPELIDPITLDPVVNPAISPYGHVMGLATWTACLSEQGICPFTKQPLRTRDLVVLSHMNYERFKDKIVR